MARGRPRKNQNPQVAATALPSTDVVMNRTTPIERDVFNREEYLGLSSKIAQDTTCNRNWPWKNARQHFEIEPLLRTVDKFYPWAKGGPLYVDEPITTEDEVMCERKAPFLKQEGLRYLIIKKDMTEHEALSQLETA